MTSVPPGVLPSRLQIAPLTRISPSRFLSLASCALREALNAGKQPPLLPSSPGGTLGTITHKLLEKAGRGTFAGSPHDAILAEWDALVADEEARMQSSWLERHLVPLRRSFRRYSVRRIQSCEKAARISARLGQPRVGLPREGAARFECEAWVETPDGLVGGFIDCVERTPEGLVLRDYKTGSLTELAEPGMEPQIKESYLTQVQLYAAAVSERDGVWPVRALLESIDDCSVVEVPIDPPECKALLGRAKRILCEANRRVEEALANPARGLAPLAMPQPSACRFCEYRPSCAAYWPARPDIGDEDWPLDMRGTLTQKTVLGNGATLIGIAGIEGVPYPVRIRGLDAGRHPALTALGEGDTVTTCNLRRDGSAGGLAQGPLTAIYRDESGEPAEHVDGALGGV